MDQVKLPTENAHEPEEEACQPSRKKKTNSKSKFITFPIDIDSSPKSSQRNNFKELLSQPPQSLTHMQRLQWLQERRGIGLWAQCDTCNSWRYIPQALDSHDLPDMWYCSMNPDPNYANCSVPEVPIQIREEEDLIHAEYSAGSVVWARLTGWPWWPAMIDDCPDTEQFYWLDGLSDIPTHYNAVFFDGKDVTRAWIASENLKPFTSNTKQNIIDTKNKKYKQRLDVAVKQAKDAISLSLSQRLAKYSFITRFKGIIYSPRKIDKRNLKKHQTALKKKFNIEFPDFSSDSDTSVCNKINPNRKTKRNNKHTNSKKHAIYEESARDYSLGDIQNVDIKVKQTTNKENGELSTTVEQKIDDFFTPLKSQESEAVIENTSIIDNDTSATYVPDTQTENTLEAHIDSPNSDDFDF